MKNLLFVALISVSFEVHADVYRCMDNNGRAVYQEQPCETAKLKPVGTVKNPADVSPEERQRSLLNAEKHKKRLDDALESRRKAEIAEKEKQEADYKRELDARNVEAQERQARAAEQAARRPAVNIYTR
ncbi:MAG: DUF4124 domain-containing protein [Sulfurimicrobium sp.]|nr:DUF4124 domain-containing protein [Sulfurimicrobium sp.]